ncbi:MAG: peptidylprolyl isomerase [Anaerolineales bacterium]
MRKIGCFVWMMVIAGLSACSPSPAVTAAAPLATPGLSTVSLPDTVPCRVINSPAATDQPALAALIATEDHALGPASAGVTILVYGDYQCAGCALLSLNLEQVRLLHPQEVRLVYRHFPLSGASHDKSGLAIRAAEAADLQGRFWEMHNLLFARQSEWSGLTPAAFEDWLLAQAAGLGLEADRFETDFYGETTQARLEAALAFAAGVQQPQLPMMFLNSLSPYTGLVDVASLDALIELELLQPRRFSECPPRLADPLRIYRAVLETERGEVTILLHADRAPFAVSNFIFLARSGWYDGVPFYRVLPDALVMTGDPSGTGLGNPGYFLYDEIRADMRFDRPGLVAMANNGPNTSGSQFFITLAPAPDLNGMFTIFGEVTSGLEVLARLTRRDPQPAGPWLPPGDLLLRVRIEEP